MRGLTYRLAGGKAAAGLAMRRGGPQGQTEERSDEGPSEQRAPKRSAAAWLRRPQNKKRPLPKRKRSSRELYIILQSEETIYSMFPYVAGYFLKNALTCSAT